MHFLFNPEIEREAKENFHAMLRKHALDLQLDRAPDRQKAFIKSESYSRGSPGVSMQDENVVAYIAKLRAPGERSYAQRQWGYLYKAKIVNPIIGRLKCPTRLHRRSASGRNEVATFLGRALNLRVQVPSLDAIPEKPRREIFGASSLVHHCCRLSAC